MLHIIREFAVTGDHALRLTYSDGEVFVVGFAPVIARGGVFAALADAAFFRLVSVGEGGRYIEWPGEIDFCADALRMEGEREQKAA